jgi:pyruvate phosphate dikinase-like enzyme
LLKVLSHTGFLKNHGQKTRAGTTMKSNSNMLDCAVCSVFWISLILAGCGSNGSSGTGTDAGPPAPIACSDAEATLGYRACVHSIPDEKAWESIASPVKLVDQIRSAKYMIPARDDARLPTLFMDANRFEMHFQFMAVAFPSLFPGLDTLEYEKLILDPANREFFAGMVIEYSLADGKRLYGYAVWDQQTDIASTIDCEQFQQVHQVLLENFAPSPLAAIPATSFQKEVLATCGLPTYDPLEALEYEPYTQGVGYGTVRRYTLAELEQATVSAEYGWQDILLLEEAPLDIETVISGAVTGTRQGELSHLNVRSASRNTPNCYVKNAHGVLSYWEGKLVRMECGALSLNVEEATLAEAEAWWEKLRPEPVEVPSANVTWTDFANLLELSTTSAQDRAYGLSRYGSKGTNLATLYQRIDAALRLDGFLVPFHYYDTFMQSNTWSVDLGNGAETLSFADTVDRYLSDTTFRSDGALRRKRLEALTDAMKQTPCDSILLEALSSQIQAVFASDQVMVRFRSSSNAEDSLQFNGAGLYNSTSACLADELDDDTTGPSLCDPDKTNERDLCRGLNRVWSSLWDMKAFEEREWYGIDHRNVAMAILVNTRTKDEQANIVAFTGNPTSKDDDRYVISAQLGEFDVVSSAPGMWPEKNLLTLEDGEVTEILRVTGSSELAKGEYVLSDNELRTLGSALWQIRQDYPIDTPPPAEGSLLLDTEWKIKSDGQLIIKQVRPFLK